MEYMGVKHPISLLMLRSVFTTLKGTIPPLKVWDAATDDVYDISG